MRTILCGVLLCAVPVLVGAQTHPCDVNPPTDYRVKKGQAVRVGWCHDSKDEDGNVIVVTGFKLQLTTPTGIDVRDLGLPAPLVGPNAQGYSYFESAPFVPASSASVAITAYSVDGDGLYSTPITLRLIGLPKPPKGARVVS